MALPNTFIPCDWHPCKGCTCANHAIPSYRFSVTDADGPIADHPVLGKLARSNDTPNSSEEVTLQQMMSDTGTRIAAVDAQVLELKALRQAFVARVDEELGAFDKERQRLSDSIRERRVILGALRRIPKEVLAHIFLHTLVFPFPRVEPAYSSSDWSTFSTSRHPLLSLELVSRNWKDVLDTFPNLWSHVNILIERMPSTTYSHYIGNQLARSRQCPLSISICHTDSSSVASLDVLPATLLMVFFTVSRRVQTLHLCLPGKYFADMRKFHLSFPNLQELALLSSSGTSGVAQHLHFGPLPHLRVFRATDVNNIDKLSLPWHQITHFTNTHTVAGRGPSALRALNILKMMPRVSVCHLSLDLESLPTEVVEETLSQLRSLKLTYVFRQGIGHSHVIPFVLNSLILPALLDLSVNLAGDALQDLFRTFTSIHQLIERSHSPLTSLYFDSGHVSKDAVIHILSNTPTLQDLRLMNVKGGIKDEVLNALARRVDTESDFKVPAFVPHLHTLHLSGYLDFQMEVCVQMVESRWACHPRHLKSVKICRRLRSGSVKEREKAKLLDLSRLDVLRSEGLDVSMSTLI